MSKRKKIIFVCTGNTCRSVMAEAIAKNKLKNNSSIPAEIDIESAGTTAMPGLPPSENAVKALESLGIDAGEFISNLLEKEDIEQADLVLTMTASHRNQVRNMVPAECNDKVYTLAEYAGVGNDVLDPIGASADVYRQCAKEIELMLNKALENFMSKKDDSKY
ncbi:MAG: low molecular weight protein arginine phosphatase [Clostridiales bacterium]|nr:low molecular weight protein arginine phosphatase [Clostridiales bacterium]MCF8022543.1 low molecular weight protein arginine phosphatase [Clostridiales bacterium]